MYFLSYLIPLLFKYILNKGINGLIDESIVLSIFPQNTQHNGIQEIDLSMKIFFGIGKKGDLNTITTTIKIGNIH